MTPSVSPNNNRDLGSLPNRSKNHKGKKKTSNLDLILQEILRKKPEAPYRASLQSNPCRASIHSNPSILTNLIMWASPGRVINLIEENSPNVNFIHMTSAIKKVADGIIGVDGNSENLEESWEELTNKLSEMLKNRSESFQHRSLCNISHSIAKKIGHSKVGLSENEVELLKLIIKKLVDKFNTSGHEFDDQNLSNLSNAFSIISERDDRIFDEITKDEFFKIIAGEITKRQLQDFDPQALAVIAFSFSKLENNFNILTQVARVINENPNQLRKLKPVELSMISRALSKKFVYNKALETIAREINIRSRSDDGLRDFTPISLSSIAWVFSNIEVSSHEILENIAYEVSLRAKSRNGLKSFPPTALTHLVLSFEKIQKNPFEFFQNIACEISLRAESQNGLKSFKSRELGLLALSFANMKINHYGVLREISHEVYTRSRTSEGLKNFGLEVLSLLAKAFSIYEGKYGKKQNYGIFNLIAREIIERSEQRDRFEKSSTEALVNLAYSFTKIDVNNSEMIKILENEIIRRMQGCPGTLEDFNPEIINKIILAFSRSEDNHSEILSCVYELIKWQYKKNILNDFSINDLATLAYGSSLGKINTRIFEFISSAIEKKIERENFETKNIEDFVLLAKAFFCAEVRDLRVFIYVANFVKHEKEKNDMAYFSPLDLVELSKVFSFLRINHGLFEDIAYAVRREREENDLYHFNPSDLAELSKAFSFLRINHGLFEDIAYAVRREREENDLYHFNPSDLAELSKAFSFSGVNYGLFEDIAYAIKKRRELNKLSKVKPKELTKLIQAFSFSEKDSEAIQDLCYEINKRALKEGGLDNFEPEELAVLSLSLSLYNPEVAIKLIEEFFKREKKVISSHISFVFYAVVSLIVTKKIREIPNEWVTKFKERDIKPPNSSNLEKSVESTLLSLGISGNFARNQHVFININGQDIKLYEVDFINIKEKQIIEVDGPSHVSEVVDSRKDFILKKLGYSILRINHEKWNELSSDQKKEYLRNQMQLKFSSRGN